MADVKAKVALVDFSYDWPWYYTPPCIGGCYVGVGATPEEAADDVLEQLAIDGYSIDEREVMDECPSGDDYDYDNEPDGGADGPWWYCAVQIQGGE